MIERLKKILDFYQLSASNFADRIDVPRSSISHLLSGRNKASLDFVMKVVDNFEDVELNWLVYGKGNFPKTESKKIVEEKIKTATPSLFTKTEEYGISEKKEVKTIYEQEITSGKNIKKIVILYTDGTFEDYKR